MCTREEVDPEWQSCVLACVPLKFPWYYYQIVNEETVVGLKESGHEVVKTS